MTAPTTSDDAAAPRLGRPRDPSIDAALQQATLDLLAEGGLRAVTMEAVAARAGVGKATLYRRHPSRDSLVLEALAGLAEPVDTHPGASVRDELVAMLEAVQRRSATRAGRIFPRLVSESVDNPELMRHYRERVMDPRRQRFLDVLARGVAEGALRPDVDLHRAVDLLIGAVAYRHLLRTEPPVTPGYAAAVVDDVLHGLTPRETA